MIDRDPVKDGTREYPVALVLRPALRAVVEALRAGDYSIRDADPMVEPVEDEVAQQIAEYIEDYGETITSLPEESWSTSVCCWTGAHWDVLVDLWTAESGRSDMVLLALVSSDGRGYRIRIKLVYVP